MRGADDQRAGTAEPDQQAVWVAAPRRRRHGPAVVPSGPMACYAPAVHLYLAPDGDVRACCRNWEALGNIATSSLIDIWWGSRRADLVDRLSNDDFSMGCQQCQAEVEIEGRKGSYRENFDRFADKVDSGWPARIEFNISNSCNLQCVMCNGFLSSSIRAHRDHLPPLPKVYGERFFRDLREFIPHLSEAQFAGGEPLLAEENFRVWDLIAELSPGLPCVVVTNATQWSPRIERLLEEHRIGFAFSIDGATKETYESIRVGANFESVMHNVDRYSEYARRSDMPVSINHCLMPQNVHEFPQLLQMAEDRGLHVDVSVVRSPVHSSIASLPLEDIRHAVDHLDRFDSAMSSLPLNGATWRREVGRIRQWAYSPDEQRELVWYDVAVKTHSPQRKAIEELKGRVLDFPRVGRGPTGVIAVREELEAIGEVVELTVAGVDNLVQSCQHEFSDLLGVADDHLIGRSVMEILPLLEARFGAVESLDEQRSDDRAEFTVTYEDTVARCIMIPMRDDHGFMDTVRLFAVITDR